MKSIKVINDWLKEFYKINKIFVAISSISILVIIVLLIYDNNNNNNNNNNNAIEDNYLRNFDALVVMFENQEKGNYELVTLIWDDDIINLKRSISSFKLKEINDEDNHIISSDWLYRITFADDMEITDVQDPKVEISEDAEKITIHIYTNVIKLSDKYYRLQDEQLEIIRGKFNYFIDKYKK